MPTTVSYESDFEEKKATLHLTKDKDGDFVFSIQPGNERLMPKVEDTVLFFANLPLDEQYGKAAKALETFFKEMVKASDFQKE